MSRYAFQGDLAGAPPIAPDGPEKTTVISPSRVGEPSVRVTPGGLRTDPGVIRHFCLSLGVLVGVLIGISLAPFASHRHPRASHPARARLHPMSLPAMPATVTPVPAPVPPVNAAPLVVPVAQVPSRNAQLLVPFVQPGFSVPPAVPIPAEGSLMAW